MKRFAVWAAVAAGALALMLCFGFCMVGGGGPGKNAKADAEIWMINDALRTYQSQNGKLSSGDQAAIVRALCGANLRKTVYLTLPSYIQKNSSGEILDPWGMPYVIDTSHGAFPQVYSPGANRNAE